MATLHCFSYCRVFKVNSYKIYSLETRRGLSSAELLRLDLKPCESIQERRPIHLALAHDLIKFPPAYAPLKATDRSQLEDRDISIRGKRTQKKTR